MAAYVDPDDAELKIMIKALQRLVERLRHGPEHRCRRNGGLGRLGLSQARGLPCGTKDSTFWRAYRAASVGQHLRVWRSTNGGSTWSSYAYIPDGPITGPSAVSYWTGHNRIGYVR